MSNLDFLLESDSASEYGKLPKYVPNDSYGTDAYDAADEDFDDEELTDEELDGIEEASLYEFALGQEVLSEQMNIVRLNKQTKLLNLSNRTALIMARKAKDPLYEKYAKFNALRLQFRGQIIKKYGTRASAYARKIMARTATGGSAAAKKPMSK